MAAINNKTLKYCCFLIISLIFLLFPEKIYCQPDPELIILEEEYRTCAGAETEVKIIVTGVPPVSITYMYNNDPGNANSSTDTIFLQLSDTGLFVITGYRDCCSDYIATSDTIYISSYDSLAVNFTGGGFQCDPDQLSPLIAHFEGTPPFNLSCYVNGSARNILSDSYTYNISYPYDFELITTQISDAHCTSEFIDTVYMIAGDIPAPEITGDTNACLNSVSEFSVDNDIYQASWTIPGISVYYFDAATNGSFIRVTWSEAGTYEIIAKLINTGSGCMSPENRIFVTVFESPDVEENIDTTACLSDGDALEIIIPVGSNETVYWPTLDYSGASNMFDEPGIYDFIVTNEWECSDTGTFVLTDNCASEIFVPTAFTPNGDGLNDLLSIFGIYHDLDFSVYSPSGILLFRNVGDTDFWDGRSEGKDVPEGSYYWNAIYIDRNDLQRVQKGCITIIR